MTGPSEKALREALDVIAAGIERDYGVRMVACDDDDPDALRLSAPDQREPLGDVGEARAAERRRDLDAQ